MVHYNSICIVMKNEAFEKLQKNTCLSFAANDYYTNIYVFFCVSQGFVNNEIYLLLVCFRLDSL